MQFEDGRLKAIGELGIAVRAADKPVVYDIVKRGAAGFASVHTGKNIHCRDTGAEQIAKERIGKEIFLVKLIHNAEFPGAILAKMHFSNMAVYILFKISGCFILITMLTFHNKFNPFQRKNLHFIDLPSADIRKKHFFKLPCAHGISGILRQFFKIGIRHSRTQDLGAFIINQILIVEIINIGFCGALIY